MIVAIALGVSVGGLAGLIAAWCGLALAARAARRYFASIHRLEDYLGFDLMPDTRGGPLAAFWRVITVVVVLVGPVAGGLLASRLWG